MLDKNEALKLIQSVLTNYNKEILTKLYSLKIDSLEKNNNIEFTPLEDYNPATKKYVDDSSEIAIGTNSDVVNRTKILVDIDATPSVILDTSNYQTRNDLNLITTNKNIVAAINEINSNIDEQFITIINDRLSVSVHDFLCDDGQFVKGDGVHDDTTGIKRALEYCKNKNKKLEFFKDKIYMVTQCYLYEGIYINGNGATIKMLANSPKATRLLTMQNSYRYSSEIDSKTIMIENLIFDGNSDNQGSFTSYEKEQQFGLFLEADTTKPGRVFANITNCTFQNFCGDGVHFYTNTVVNCSNIFVKNCFRGGVVVSGGNSTFNISNYIVDSKFGNGLDIEVDVLGYNNQGITANVNNIITNRPCDFGNLFNSNTKINISNMIATDGRINITVKYGEVNFSNSTVSTLEAVNCTNLKISNVNFISNGTSDILNIKSIDSDISLTRDKYNTVVTNCKFSSSSGAKLIALKAFLTNVKVTNCEFSESISIALFAYNTPLAVFEQNVINCDYGLKEYKTSTIDNSKYIVRNNTYLNTNTIPFQLTTGGTGWITIIDETYYDVNHLKFENQYSYSTFGTLYNLRKLISNIDPTITSVPGVAGDTIVSPTYYSDNKKFICIKSSNTSATWKLI